MIPAPPPALAVALAVAPSSTPARTPAAVDVGAVARDVRLLAERELARLREHRDITRGV